MDNEYNKKYMKLSELKLGELAQIETIVPECKGETRRRLLDLGFVRGTKISVQNISPLRNPTAYSIKNTLIALRKDQADLILIQKGSVSDE